jgi:hypothetical protein
VLNETVGRSRAIAAKRYVRMTRTVIFTLAGGLVQLCCFDGNEARLPRTSTTVHLKVGAVQRALHICANEFGK